MIFYGKGAKSPNLQTRPCSFDLLPVAASQSKYRDALVPSTVPGLRSRGNGLEIVAALHRESLHGPLSLQLIDGKVARPVSSNCASSWPATESRESRRRRNRRVGASVFSKSLQAHVRRMQEFVVLFAGFLLPFAVRLRRYVDPQTHETLEQLARISLSILQVLEQIDYRNESKANCRHWKYIGGSLASLDLVISWLSPRFRIPTSRVDEFPFLRGDSIGGPGLLERVP